MTLDQLAFALTAIVANLDDDPYDDLAPAMLSPADATRLREVHAAAHQLRRRGDFGGGSVNWIDLQKAAMREALRRSGGKPKMAAEMLGINPSTLWKWRKEHGIDLAYQPDAQASAKSAATGRGRDDQEAPGN